jgi:hypothetical protein
MLDRRPDPNAEKIEARFIGFLTLTVYYEYLMKIMLLYEDDSNRNNVK